MWKAYTTLKIIPCAPKPKSNSMWYNTVYCTIYHTIEATLDFQTDLQNLAHSQGEKCRHHAFSSERFVIQKEPYSKHVFQYYRLISPLAPNDAHTALHQVRFKFLYSAAYAPANYGHSCAAPIAVFSPDTTNLGNIVLSKKCKS